MIFIKGHKEGQRTPESVLISPGRVHIDAEIRRLDDRQEQRPRCGNRTFESVMGFLRVRFGVQQ